ncbi:MAG: nitroreductase/quinone reductase family protein [Anaerolineaceae bacterium]|nr:nitroreductase/quinone reductase family protein [Anaerolineaceae bacterium]
METLLTLFSPRSALVRALYRLPLLLWRMGLGWMLPRSMLVLTTRGRVSGLPRHTMLEQFVHKGQVVVGSAWGDRSQWALNLAASDVVSAETWSGGVTRARARAIRDETVLADLRKKLPSGSEESDGRSRISDFLFWTIEAADVAAPAPLRRDLRHVPLLLLALFILLFVLSRGFAS